MLPMVDETTAQMVARLRAVTGDVAVDALNSAADSDPLTAQNVLAFYHTILGIGCKSQLMLQRLLTKARNSQKHVRSQFLVLKQGIK